MTEKYYVCKNPICKTIYQEPQEVCEDCNESDFEVILD